MNTNAEPIGDVIMMLSAMPLLRLRRLRIHIDMRAIIRDPEHCVFDIDKDGVNVYLYTDAINISGIADIFPDINVMKLGDAYSDYLNPMCTETDFSNFQSIKEIDYYGNWISNEDVDKISRKFPNCHIEQNTTLPY